MNLIEMLKNRGWSGTPLKLVAHYIPKAEQERIASELENGKVENG